MDETTDPLATVRAALAAEWEDQRRTFNGATYRQCVHCQGTTYRGHDANCPGEAARRAVDVVGERIRALEEALEMTFDAAEWRGALEPRNDGYGRCPDCDSLSRDGHRDFCRIKRARAVWRAKL